MELKGRRMCGGSGRREVSRAKCECGCGLGGVRGEGVGRGGPGVVVPTFRGKQSHREAHQAPEGGLLLQVPEGVWVAFGIRVSNKFSSDAGAGQGPHFGSSDSTVTENLAPWSLEEMTGARRAHGVWPRALMPVIPTETHRQAHISDHSVSTRDAENTGASTGMIACPSSRASQQDVFMGVHCFQQEHVVTLLLEKAALLLRPHSSARRGAPVQAGGGKMRVRTSLRTCVHLEDDLPLLINLQ